MSKKIAHATLVAALCIAFVAHAQTAPTTPAPVAPPAPPPAAPAAAPKPVTVVLKGSLFDTNRATLKAAAKLQLDQDVVAKISSFGQVKQVIIGGHTDRLGKAAVKQKLSEKRADAVKDYLVSKGVDSALIETLGYGATQPVQGLPKCEDSLPKAKLVECLEPHNRVEIEIQPAVKYSAARTRANPAWRGVFSCHYPRP